MRTAGEWMGKLRRITSDVRAQTGIDDILREEGIDGVGELRTLLRGQGLRSQSRPSSSSTWSQPAPQPADLSQEFPVEGVDCSSALADDLLAEASTSAPAPDQNAAPLLPPETTAETAEPGSSH